jgi:menaquinol-cytochrome c reductase iron-sulfur subunit
MNDLRHADCAGGRRDFVRKLAAGLLGALVALVPAGAGLVVMLAPLRRRLGGGDAVRVTTLDALHEDGVPRKFPVLANKRDGWTQFPMVPVGAVLLRRIAGGKVQAFNAVCPHAGCLVGLAADQQGYFCPCHNSAFTLDGAVGGPSSPSPRGLDPLEVEVRNEKEVWVKFQNFQVGKAERIPVA